MIVRNEEKVLPRCLKSVQDVADELIVVDTGSKDNTISVAKDLGAKIFHFKWCDDFSAARNEALKHANGDWILQIDADEELSEDSISPLREAMSNPWALGYLIKCDDGPKASHRFGWIARFFRNHPGVRYERPYHESVELSVEKLVRKVSAWQLYRVPNIVICHYGYEPSKMAEKCERGLRTMKSYLYRNPNDCYILAKLANAYYGLTRYDEGQPYLEKALRINPDLWEANYTLGLVQQKRGEAEAAIQSYRKAIGGNPLLAEAHANLGVIYVEKGMPDRAISELEKALAINPDLAVGYSTLGLAYINKGMYDKGTAMLKQAIGMDAELAGAHMNLAVACTKKGMLDEGILEYKKGADN
jgi:tetratricopeptide (TPR) repeat protein